MNSIARLLDPASIAVVGASQNGGRGVRVLRNLKELGFSGDAFAINPKYNEVEGYPCLPSIKELPTAVDCVVAAVAADIACEALEQAYEKGVRAAVVLAAGFGEGGRGASRAARVRALAQKGMAICGPNCFGALNVKTGGAAYSGNVPKPLRSGSVALVSQSGGLGSNVFMPLMIERRLGFSHIISCGNQLGVSIEDYVDYLVRDPAVAVVAAIVECLREPHKLIQSARLAHENNKTIVLFQAGRSAAGQIMTHSHTGALTGDSVILSAHLRRCGIVRAETYEELIEAVELFAHVPAGQMQGRNVVVVSGSGGGAAVAADALDGTGVILPEFSAEIGERIQNALPDFGSVTNPIDGTGVMSDDPKLVSKLYDAILAEEGDATIASSLSAWPAGNKNGLRFAESLASVARSSGRTVVAYQPSGLGGPLDGQIVDTLHSAGVPLLLGISNGMKALRYLGQRSEGRWRAKNAASFDPAVTRGAPIAADCGFLEIRAELARAGVSVVDAKLARSEQEAVAVFREFGRPVAIKAEVAGLLHKSDIGGVVLNRVNEHDVAEGYHRVIDNARRAGHAAARDVVIQPMIAGVAEAYAGIINDPLFGPAITFGLGGVFVEIFKDVTTEMAPLGEAEARGMIDQIKGAALLQGARGRPRADIDALVVFLMRLSDFAVANFGRFHSLDLNPIMIGAAGQGVVAVDIAVEAMAAERPTPAAVDERQGGPKNDL